MYVALDRVFSRTPHGDDNKLAGFSDTLSWQDILREACVVVLGEAGLGKSTAFAHQVETLNANGQKALLVPLLDVARDDAAVWTDEVQLAEWLRSAGDVYFLIDAIDEARLQDQTLDRAVGRLSRLTRIHSAKLHFIFSARATDWRGEDDARILARLTPISTKRARDGVTSSTDTLADAAPLVVHMLPLTLDQVEHLARAEGVKDAVEFVAAVRLARAEVFVQRPRDVRNLAIYWMEHRRLGSSTELMEHDLNLRLREHNVDRPDPNQLSTEEARIGAEQLAAACTLGKSLSLRLPGARESRAGEQSVVPEEALPSWTRGRIEALLSMGLFQVATYGRVRFHHRSVQEYLTACWFRRLIRVGLPSKNVIDLYFPIFESRRLVAPTLSASAGWLAGMDDGVREAAIAFAPHTILFGGDPEALPVPERSRALMRWLELQGADLLERDEHDDAQARRFADPRLAPAISESLASKPPPEPRAATVLLRLCRNGQMRMLYPQIIAIVVDASASPNVRGEAVRTALALAQTAEQRGQLVASLLSVSSLPVDCASALIESAFPSILQPRDLGRLIAILQPDGDVGRSALAWKIEQALTLNRDSATAVETAKALLFHTRGQPNRSRSSRLPTRDWVLSALSLSAALAVAFAEDVEHILTEMSEVVEHLAAVSSEHSLYREADSWREACKRSQPARRAHFWARTKQLREPTSTKRTVRKPSQVMSRLASTINVEDLAWLFSDAAQAEPFERRLLAFGVAMRAAERLGTGRDALRTLAQGDARLARHLERWSLRSQSAGPRSTPDRYEQARLRREARQLQENKAYLLERLEDMRSGQALHLMLFLRDETAIEARSTWPQADEGTICRLYGEEVASAFVDGLLVMWRQFRPVLPAHKPEPNSVDSRVTLGLGALELIFRRSELYLELTPEDADLATRYALNELNGFPNWFPALLRSNFSVVQRVLHEAVSAELSPSASTTDVLHALQSSPDEVVLASLPSLIDGLGAGKAPGPAVELAAKLLDRECVPGEFVQRLCVEYLAKGISNFRDWWPVLLRRNPSLGLEVLQTQLLALAEREATSVMEAVLSSLRFRDLPHLPATVLAPLAILAHRHVRPQDDVVRVGVYSPGVRDEAQSGRARLLGLLADQPGPSALGALRLIESLPLPDGYLSWVRETIQRKIETESDLSAWKAASVAEFGRRYEFAPTSADALFSVVIGKLDALADEMRNGDHSYRAILTGKVLEYEYQKWLSSILRLMSHGLYHVAREEEINQRFRPDIRVWSRSSEVVGIEVKRVEEWTGPQLVQALSVQLIGQYLRAANANHGILLLVKTKRNRRWQPRPGVALDFQGLLSYLNGLVPPLLADRCDLRQVRVIGLDLTDH